MVEPALTARTKVIHQSELLGFPPFVARTDRLQTEVVEACQTALLGLGRTTLGRQALELLQLDGVVPGDPSLFDGIRARMRDLAKL